MILFGLVLSLVTVYALVILVAAAGWLKKENKKTGSEKKEWTVIVPFRNEEKNLPRLLKSFSAQKKSFHIILVNDHSTDRSLQVITETVASYPALHVTVLTNEGEGKKMASATGLKTVKTNYVLFTDADGEMPEGFLETTTVYTDEADFFYGPVIYGFNGERTNAVFFLDQLALNAVSLGLGKMGVHTYCSGANMGGKTEKLQTAIPQLQKSANLSGDDITYLQQAIVQKQKINALTDRELTVHTAAPVNLGEFLQQRLRWGQKASGYKSFVLLALSALVWLTNSTVLLVLICCLSGCLPACFDAIPLVKLCIDLLFLFLVTLRLRVHARLWAFLLAWLLNLMYIPALAIVGVFTNTSWKGRKVKRN